MRKVLVALWAVLFCGMVWVWATQIMQSYLNREARTKDQLYAAMVVPSPVGDYGAEVARRWFSLAQDKYEFEAGLPYIPAAGPHRTAVLVIINVRTEGGTCDLLTEWAPLRYDVQDMCRR